MNKIDLKQSIKTRKDLENSGLVEKKPFQNLPHWVLGIGLNIYISKNETLHSLYLNIAENPDPQTFNDNMVLLGGLGAILALTIGYQASKLFYTKISSEKIKKNAFAINSLVAVVLIAFSAL